MEQSYDPGFKDNLPDCGRKIIMHPLYHPKLPPWLDIKVFYVRVSSCDVHESTSDCLTVNHIPLHPDTVIEVNGRRSNIYSDCISSYLRRDRVDMNSEEATFVSTDSIRVTGSVRFEVFDENDLMLVGVLEFFKGNGYVGESKGHEMRWSINCHPVESTGVRFLKGKQCTNMEIRSPTLEVYVAGCFSGNPIILTKTVKLGLQKKNQKKLVLNSIPENDSMELMKDFSSEDALQLSDYQDSQIKNDLEMDYDSINLRTECLEGEDGELSWFNAGVRVGVGISIGICLGVGIGVGLLVCSYQATARNFKRLI
ncbi:Uncharacterized protein AXF42_Ash010397 [Apostasia shenzhenica]|uniref:Erythronate-4-phosphate dehydrogenase family protein n=1 Tax=Apostasia shenzhenica TaxID=1088818 RepID=A0A2I0BDX9_9ASPA|nr:Uncharacterized protein AXF42_Ash010397 [Apostasia shenzhenica]